MMIPVILESPYSPGVPKDDPEFARLLARNLAYARAAVKDCLDRGESAYVSHLLLTQDGILDDAILTERQTGIRAGLVWGKFAQKTVYYSDLGISPGMKLGLAHAEDHGRLVEERTLPGWLEKYEQEISGLKNLHMYGQQQWHDDTFIVGNSVGLRELQITIRRVLDSGLNQKTSDVFAADGEGYSVNICLVEDDNKFQELAVPYTDDIAKQRDGTGVWPWSLIAYPKGQTDPNVES